MTATPTAMPTALPSRRAPGTWVSLASATLFACGSPASPAPAQTLSTALAAVRARPRAALEACAAVDDPRWRGDCLIAAVERLAARDEAAAAALCEAVPRPEEADECWFQLAERSGAAQRCGQAGRFADDCRLHAWVAGMSAWLPARPSADPAVPAPEWAADVVQAASIAAKDAGFDAQDERPWTALFRQLHARADRPDPRLCGDFEAMGRAEACQAAGRAIFRDLLLYRRDTGALDCAAAREEALLYADPAWRDVMTEVTEAAGCPRAAGP
jgi:hypothetical protein